MRKALALKAGKIEGFDRFWAAFPRRVKKKDAQKAWLQLAPDDALVDQMIAALEWQRQQPQWTKDSGQYVPFPASWIRAEQWNDEPFHAPPELSARTRKLARATEEFLK